MTTTKKHREIYMRWYYKHDKYERNAYVAKHGILAQLVWNEPFNEDDYKKIKRHRRHIYPFKFISYPATIIEYEYLTPDNQDLVRFVIDNAPHEGIWSLRFSMQTKTQDYGHHHPSYCEVIKVLLKEDKYGMHGTILKAREDRLRHYWFRKPDFKQHKIYE